MVGMEEAEVSGRRFGAHDPQGRRRDVLAAARRLFASKGYEQTSIRAIAAEAKVNPALVVTYFGGKEALFLEVVGPFTMSKGTVGGIDGMGARLARMYVDRWENMSEDDPWPALARSAVSHEGSARLLRSALEQQYAPLCEALGDSEEGRARTAMVRCLIAGMIMERYIYALEPARSVPTVTFEAALANALQHALNGPLPGATEGAAK
jgi:AcrR family transcriptional regulator